MTRWIWALLVPLAGPVQAHGWYDPYCCAEKDCRPLQDSEVQELPRGWNTPDGSVGYGDARVKPSLDGHFHICTNPGTSPFTVMPKKYAPIHIRCLYVPPRGT